MISLLKVAMLLFLAALAAFTACTVGAGAYLLSGGIANVRVDTPDVDLRLPVPVRFVDLGLGVAGMAAPSPEQLAIDLDLSREELGAIEEWRPLVRELADRVDELPEGELVRVRTATEDVRIAQVGGRFRIDVEAPDAEVHVSVPRRAAARILRKVAAL